MDEDEALRWFRRGFLQSREGFNGECSFEHLAPLEAVDKDTYGLLDGDTGDELDDLFYDLWEDEADA